MSCSKLHSLTTASGTLAVVVVTHWITACHVQAVVVPTPFVDPAQTHSFYLNAAAYLEISGYADWHQRLGGDLPTGGGVILGQVESGHPSVTSYPNTTLIGSSLGSVGESHANTVASILNGTNFSDSNAFFPRGLSNGILEDQSWASTVFKTDVLKLAAGNDFVRQAGLLPVYPSVANDGTPIAGVPQILNVSNSLSGSSPLANRAFDYFVDQNNILAFTAQPGSFDTNVTVSGSNYNGIVVGKATTDLSYAGGTQFDNQSEPRPKPDIVSSSWISGSGGGASSWTTPTVASGAAALLGHATSTPMLSGATNSEVMKAIVMAGATKHNLHQPIYNEEGTLIDVSSVSGSYTWSRSPTTPLDVNYGVGSFNINNSHLVLTSGEYDASSTSLASSTGWDFGTSTNGEQLYFFDVPAESAGAEFSAVLTWNRTVTDLGGTDYGSTLADLNLSLHQASGFEIQHSIDTSIDQAGNVEHIFPVIGVDQGRYALRVTGDTAGVEFGLAWFLSDTIGPFNGKQGDLNQNGVVNSEDRDLFVEGWLTSGHELLLEQYLHGDLNFDGITDLQDWALMQNALAAESGTLLSMRVPEPSALLLIATACFLIGFSRNPRKEIP